MNIKSFIENYIKIETFAGILLIFVSAAAIGIANTESLYPAYTHLQHMPAGISFGDFKIEKSLLHWVNDGWMTLFFLLISLEIKREILIGELSSIKKAILPVIAAIGGMVVPALIFIAFTSDSPSLSRGWAVPVATDIAFALGILALLGKRVPMPLKIFLTTLAVVDDLGAIIILAIFYSTDLNTTALLYSGAMIFILLALNYNKVASASVYLFIGTVLWFLLLKSGLHATLAGVITALAIPHKPSRKVQCPLEDVEHRLHGWVTFLILPMFAFLNAGVKIPALTPELFTPLSLGIILALFVGKQIGVLGFAGLAIKLRWAKLPTGVNLMQLYGVAILCGIGFTMSLFIGSVAYTDQAIMQSVRLSVIIASTLSALWGIFILFIASKR